jgi:hypothetical protein
VVCAVAETLAVRHQSDDLVTADGEMHRGVRQRIDDPSAAALATSHGIEPVEHVVGHLSAIGLLPGAHHEHTHGRGVGLHRGSQADRHDADGTGPKVRAGSRFRS